MNYNISQETFNTQIVQNTQSLTLETRLEGLYQDLKLAESCQEIAYFEREIQILEVLESTITLGKVING